eukprot:TRINITY_DN15850_c0_g1_i6.p1 TRINITY_DN15850_c0_g1~~TRINITY_DN15850_c0_g1_i6.p1  ORF type:complete len:287 (-),score=71.30 TRINITY_DN15850_c0_g1_i6:368-1228(-)
MALMAAEAAARQAGLTEAMIAMDGEAAVHVILEVLRLKPTVCPHVINFACPALTYCPAKGMSERRCRGTLKFYDKDQGFGLISSPEIEAIFGQDAIVSEKQVGQFQVGEELTFSCCLSAEIKPQAFDVLDKHGLPPVRQDLAVAAASSSGPWGGGWGANDWSDGWSGDDWNSWGGDWGGGDWGMGGGMSMGGWGDDAKRRRLAGPGYDDSAAPAIGQYTGTIKNFSDKNGFGFIHCPELTQMQGDSKDVFLHGSQCQGLPVGSVVRFTAYMSASGQLRARDVTPFG